MVNETMDPNYSNTSSVHPVCLDFVLDTQPSHSPDISSDTLELSCFPCTGDVKPHFRQCRSRFRFFVVRGMDLTTSAATCACESFWIILDGDVTVVTGKISGIKEP